MQCTWPVGAVNRVFDGIEDVAVWALEALLTMVRPLLAVTTVHLR